MAERCPRLNERDQAAAAHLFAFFWAVLVLNPSCHRKQRAVMVKAGLVKPRGRLSLTATGERLIAFNRAQFTQGSSGDGA